MSYYEYDEQFPITPPYIEYDSAMSINPGLKRQHAQRMATFGTNREYQSAPQTNRGYESAGPRPELHRLSTFVLEETIYNMKNRVDYIFWIMVVILILVIIGVVISTLSLMVGLSVNKRSV